MQPNCNAIFFSLLKVDLYSFSPGNVINFAWLKVSLWNAFVFLQSTGMSYCCADRFFSYSQQHSRKADGGGDSSMVARVFTMVKS